MENKEILKGVNGVFKPGTVTLVLGRPNSGKSSLMKLLSGRLPDDKNISVEGEVTYNGVPSGKLRKVLPQFVSYVTQSDKHYAILTVKETLEFAHTCYGGNHSESRGVLQQGVDVTETIQKQHPDVVINHLGLKDCQNAIIGDTRMPGVSLDECKRVTTSEMTFGNNCVLMLNEIDTGLDSSETFDIITAQRSYAKKFHKTVVISLVHPSAKMFALFDDVMILNEGRVIFHGPCEKKLTYFESLGFKCPLRLDVANFLLDLGTEEQYRYEVKGDLDESSTMLRREVSALMMRLVMSVFMGLIISSMYYQLDPTDSQLILGVIFDALIYVSVGQSVQIPIAMAAREIFYKQRGANFFHTTSYVLSNYVSRIPSIILEMVAFGSVVYWMCGFEDTFFIFVAMLCLMSTAFVSFFFFLASVSPNLKVAKLISHVCIVFLTTYAGFAITKDQIPDYLVWIYWINPVGWGVRALAVNQYSDSQFDICA
ncbi:hypothetical protein BBO99_00008340 [Phytophthora kernoviae]|uniref:ABC transporter domain-containing protein n=2 Tax=Phytophthora kernoviae TaxID=325452 RepID=A0A3R7NBF0_9STRA|nr:hypothetical protein G195_009995 [Phytophthora kernoviae 00238/432]KAG2509946.1 hypothetical protein JM16_008394 [Phytophthora kernoviae]KAG2512334.1 hypothetical protein JM18_008205 [Phytophthora kernoviae]RLN21272.1 hypothetical protein BBI17_008276 [Phytophthora kernoviae]RLN75428.1 hypothetical protein BBO99_00008340 [Phytophthora kernoviae]